MKVGLMTITSYRVSDLEGARTGLTNFMHTARYLCQENDALSL